MPLYEFCRKNHERTEQNTVYIHGRIQCKICYKWESASKKRAETVDTFMRRLDAYLEEVIKERRGVFAKRAPERVMLRKSVLDLIKLFRKEEDGD